MPRSSREQIQGQEKGDREMRRTRKCCPNVVATELSFTLATRLLIIDVELKVQDIVSCVSKTIKPGLFSSSGKDPQYHPTISIG